MQGSPADRVAAKENQPQAYAYVQDEAWPGANVKRRPIARYTVELGISAASVQQHRLIKERLRCHHVQLKVVETTMGRKEQRKRERKKAAKGSHALSGFGFSPKSDRGPTVTWTRRRRVNSGSSWKRTALRDRPASYKNKTKEALCSRLQRLPKWVLNLVIFVPAGPQNVSPVLNDLARLKSNCEISNYPSLWFSGIYSYSFFFLVCLHVEGDFVFSFFLLFGISSRTTHRFDRPWLWRGKINKQRRCARKSAELVLVAFLHAPCRCSIVKKSVCLYLV